MDYRTIEVEVKNNIYFVGFGKNEEKSLTTISEDTLQSLNELLSKIASDSSARGVIFHSLKPGVFLAGMDISVIQNLDSAAAASEGCSKGQAIFSKIEDLKVPTLAMIDGFCLGGGLELALSCNKILVSDSSHTKLGLPEVMLGVLPGFGGTYRLPNKVGMANALDMILTGKQLRAKKAFKLGLADYILPVERFFDFAEEYLFKKATPKKKNMNEKIMGFMEGNFLLKKVIFSKAREGVMKKTKGFYPAPLKIIELLESHSSRNRERYLAKEAKAFGELSQTKQSKNLIHLFFLHDNSKKYNKDLNLKNIKTGAVLGAGTMGGGIAWYFASNNIPCFMKDLTKEALNLGLKQASSVFSKKLKRRRMSKDDFNKKMTSISPTLTYDGFNGVDLVIEAIVENMDVKKSVFKELETKVSEDALLTSNTSSLSVEEMASVLDKPERFAGLHFFNPVNKMPLVEIIKHSKVSDETIQSLYKFVVESKKTPVVVNDGPGFLVNRILATYLNEAGYMLEEGYTIQELDKVATDFGLPMGPCHLMDEVGIDVSNKVGKILFDGLGDRFRPSELSSKVLELGLLGKKGSKGFYLYDEKGKKGEVNSEIKSVLPSNTKTSNLEKIKERLIFPMINEAANCLEDKIVEKVDDLDLAMIFGIGFPPFKGGLLKYADSKGLSEIVKSLEGFSKEVSKDRFNVSPYLKKLADANQKFY